MFTVGFHSLVAENARGIQSLNDGAADGAAIFPLLRPVLTGWKKWGGARRSYERQKIARDVGHDNASFVSLQGMSYFCFTRQWKRVRRV